MNFTTLPDPAPLLAPLLLDGPCGVDLRYDQVYDKILELARSEDEYLPMGIWEREYKKSDWSAVTALCFEVLSTRSKDMQIVAWLGQALTRLHGPIGAAFGWTMFARLTSIFWNDIHPRMEDNDVEIRLCSVEWFTTQTGHWLTEYLGLKASGSDALLPIETISAENLAALKSLLQELQQFQLFFDQKLGQQSPLFHQLTDPLQKRLDSLNTSTQAALADSVIFNETQIMTSAPIQVTSNSRDAAYATLGDIARILSKSEPHSPVPMILEALVSWRDCQFNDLLERMPQDKASLYELLKFFKHP